MFRLLMLLTLFVLPAVGWGYGSAGGSNKTVWYCSGASSFIGSSAVGAAQASLDSREKPFISDGFYKRDVMTVVSCNQFASTAASCVGSTRFTPYWPNGSLNTGAAQTVTACSDVSNNTTFTPYTNASCNASNTGCVYKPGFRAPPAGTQNSGGGTQSTDGVPYTCDAGAMTFQSGYGGNSPTAAMAPRLTCMSGVGSAPGSDGAKYAGCQLEFVAATAKCGVGGDCYSSGVDALNGRFCEGTATARQGANGTPPVMVSPDLGAGQSPPVTPCSAGQCPGTVNGASICVACSSTATPGSAQTVASGASGAAPTLGPNAPAGATSSQDVTVCNSTGCVTTTNYYNPAGAAVGSSSKTTGAETPGFCQQNPTLQICKSSSYAGACGQSTCSGDAVQCAIADEQAKRNCALWNDAPANHPGVVAANGQSTPAGHPGAPGVVSAVSVSSAMDLSDAIGGGASCLADQTFAVGEGHSVVIAWSQACTALGYAGSAIQALSALVFVFIAFKS